ncbi:MAG: hypothetical protein JWL77_1169, partial [Chthonomonadaceae bacterium]|nr:hypothetical protein [Chthonomonadaceae bacterium]
EPEEPTEDDLPVETEGPDDEESLPERRIVRSKSKSGSSRSRDSARSSKREPAEPKLRAPTRVSSVWQFAYHRLQVLGNSSAARREVVFITLLLVLIFAVPFVSWMRRFLLPDSLQFYGVVILPLTLGWIWLNRYRLMLPELDTLMKRYQAGRMDRLSPAEKWAREEREYNAVVSLLKEKPLPPKRLLWPLVLAGIFTFVATWMDDPTITGLAFVFLVIGLVGYRHGTQALRVAAFPLLFLFLLVPIPGDLLESVRVWLTGRLMSLLLHVLLNSGMQAELALEYNPLKVLAAQPYEMWASQVHMGLAPALLFLVGMIWYLSLVRARFRTKLFAIACGMVWMSMLLAVRLTLLAWVGINDKDLVSYLAPATLLLLPVLGAVGELFVLRGIKCQKYQKWVSI